MNQSSKFEGCSEFETNFIEKEWARIKDQDMSASYLARQIVDNAYRAGIDIRFKQHIVEAMLRE